MILFLSLLYSNSQIYRCNFSVIKIPDDGSTRFRDKSAGSQQPTNSNRQIQDGLSNPTLVVTFFQPPFFQVKTRNENNKKKGGGSRLGDNNEKRKRKRKFEHEKIVAHRVKDQGNSVRIWICNESTSVARRKKVYA